uniref:TYR_PHOSPHATASE_2 domain-containing protein n=1 Tax=Rhabditophanes sp. KR3021 TaxID=114890 RepID=A0AC35U4Q4_9BILA
MTLVNEHVNGEITSIKPDKKQAYSYLRNKAVQFTPSHLACQFACGGSSCKYCNDIAWTEKQQVIKGLYSNWINEDILAMARPIEPNIIKHDMIKQFRENNIVSLINLQVAGEHSKCGSYMHKSGFSYDPEMFMKQKIFYYNFPMQDFDSTDVQGLLSIAKVIHFAVQQGKVAIHCHAGLGILDKLYET